MNCENVLWWSAPSCVAYPFTLACHHATPARILFENELSSVVAMVCIETSGVLICACINIYVPCPFVMLSPRHANDDLMSSKNSPRSVISLWNIHICCTRTCMPRYVCACDVCVWHARLVHLRIHVFVKYTNIDKRLVHLTCPFSLSQCCDAVHEDKTRMDHTITKSGSKAGGSSRSGREGFGNTSSTQVNESAEMVVTVRDFARSAQRSAPPATAAPEIAARTPLQDKSNISPNVSPKMQSLKSENEIEALTSSYNKNVLESWQQKKPAATQNAYANIPDNVSAYPAFSNIRNSPDHANHPNNARLFATNSNTSGEPKIKHPTQQNSRTGARWRRSFSSELPRTTGS